MATSDLRPPEQYCTAPTRREGDSPRIERFRIASQSTNAESKVQYLAAPITVGGVANIQALSVFDAVYSSVRGSPFAVQAMAVSKGAP
jgi:hypothetical protein